MKIAVIGSVSSGLSVAEQLSAGCGDVQISLFERASCCSCGTHGLPHYLGMDRARMGEALAGCALTAQHVDIQVGREVTAVDPENRTLTLRDVSTGEVGTACFDRLVLATGSRPRPLGIPGSGRMGVHPLRSVDDLLLLREFVRTPYVRDIVVLGCGLPALEVAGAFLALGRTVRVIDSGRDLLPGFDPEVATQVQRELEGMGVRFSLGESVAGFQGRTFVETVQTDRGTYPCDLCVPCLEEVPNTELLPTADRDETGRLLVSEGWETSLPGIYAAGSCALCRSGGGATVCVKVHTLEVARCGLSEAQARQAGYQSTGAAATGRDRTGVSPNTGSVTVKLVYDKPTGRVLGAQIWGGADSSARINAIAVAVQAGMTVDQLSGTRFLSSSASGAPWDPIHLACAAAKH